MSANPLLRVGGGGGGGGGGLGTRLIHCMVGVCNGQKLQLSYICNTLSLFPYCSLAICNAVRTFLLLAAAELVCWIAFKHLSVGDLLHTV